MPHPPTEKEHFNLYYIFEEDKRCHPPDNKVVEAVRIRLLKMMANKSA